jgi:hypothetical protein
LLLVSDPPLRWFLFQATPQDGRRLEGQLHLIHLVRLAVKASDALLAFPGREASKVLQNQWLACGDSCFRLTKTV